MNELTLEKLRRMKFFGMLRAFKTSLESGQLNTLTADELIAFLVESEYDDRNNRRIERHIHQAKFRYKANVEQLHFDIDRNLDKNMMMRFADCSFVEKHENVLITGSTGIGKSFVASALGNQACMLGYSVIYANAAKLFSKLKMTKADGSYVKEIGRIEKQDLLILDDFGIHPMDANTRLELLEIIEDRHGKRSTLISSQLPVAKWYEIFEDGTIADALMDRLLHNTIRIDMKGESLRKKK